MRWIGFGLLLLFAGCGRNVSVPIVNKSELKPSEVVSGSTFLLPETRALQDDQFENPGLLWVDRGRTLFNEPPSARAPTCASCHSETTKDLNGVAAHYPVVDTATGKLVNIEGRINLCLNTVQRWGRCNKLLEAQKKNI